MTRKLIRHKKNRRDMKYLPIIGLALLTGCGGMTEIAQLSRQRYTACRAWKKAMYENNTEALEYLRERCESLDMELEKKTDEYRR